MDPKGTPNGAKMGPENETNLEAFSYTNLDHDLDHSEEPKWKQMEVAEGGQKEKSARCV